MYCAGTLFWHELLSCAGSAEDRSLMRLCFIPQQGRSSALPPLFLARLAKMSGQWPAEVVSAPSIIPASVHGQFVMYLVTDIRFCVSLCEISCRFPAGNVAADVGGASAACALHAVVLYASGF